MYCLLLLILLNCVAEYCLSRMSEKVYANCSCFLRLQDRLYIRFRYAKMYGVNVVKYNIKKIFKVEYWV